MGARLRTTTIAALSFGDDAAIPTSFRLFHKGWNDTENGRFLFDDAAAQSVMAAYRAWGVDLAIDLEHQMLKDPTADPTARDARGWCKLELRSDGSLWAVGVRWTPDGTARLSEKRQRYISPAFKVDPETCRVEKIVNIALVAMPATHNTPALVAASVGAGMDPSLVKKALDAIEAGDAAAASEILKNMIAAAAGAGTPAEGDDAGSEGDGAEGAPPAAESVAAKAPEAGDDEEDDDDAPPSSKGPPMKKNSAQEATEKALIAMLKRETGKDSLAEALATVQDYKISHLTLETERQKIARERATLESAERRKLCTELVKLGAEFPSTVWADDKATSIKPRWQKMPIEELRTHVADQRTARGKKKETTRTEITPARGEQGSTTVELTAAELAICEQTKCEPKVFAQLKAVRDGAVKAGG